MIAPATRRAGMRFGAAAVACISVALAAASCSVAEHSPSPGTASPTATPPTATTASAAGDCCASPSAPPGALVTARPSRETPPPTIRLDPTTPPDSLGRDRAVFSVTVPPAGSVTVPIDFEGATESTLLGYTESASLIVTFRGQPLRVGPAMGPSTEATFGDTYRPPVNGDLVLKNPTAAPVAVEGFATITTRRHLSLHPSSTYTRKGQAYSVDVSLTEATESDGLKVTVRCDDVAPVPLVVVRVAVGRWTASGTASSVGSCNLDAITTGTRARDAMGAVEVVSGEASLSSSFTTQLLDEDHNGLIDKLVLTPNITLGRSGRYDVEAFLVDEVGATVTSDTREIDLKAGAQPLSLEFGGPTIYRSRRWGPYALEVKVTYLGPGAAALEIPSVVVGKTAAYDYMQFERECDACGSE
jgi:hypothetical protein